MTSAADNIALACFGELMIRFSTPNHLLLTQCNNVDLHVAGAEANVAVGFASLGYLTRMISHVADNPLGDKARRTLMAAGVDCRYVTTGQGRMATYFLTSGAGHRASEVFYDRDHTAFVNARPEDFDWDSALAGITHIHLSGIVPSLGPGMVDFTRAAAQAARAKGITVIFDGNYRPRLWEAWDSDPRVILTELIGMADILFGNHRDVALLLDRDFSGDRSERRREAAEAAFEAFPNLKLMASTARHIETVDRHRISARVDAPDDFAQTPEILVSGIVDRIGGGDAFVAGVLHGLISHSNNLEYAAKSGLALTVLKHFLPGDMSTFGKADIDGFLNGELDVRR